MYQNLADFLHLKLSQTTLEEIEKHNTWYLKSMRNVVDFSHGFFSGESENGVGMVGSLAADMTVIGDLRDLKREGSKFAQDKPYDKVIMGIAAVGLGLSVSQLVTAGGTTPLKVGASLIKVAKKSGKISKPFMKFISAQVRKTVDMKLLKKVNFSSLSKLRASTSKVVKSLNLTHVRKLFGDIHKIQKNTSLMDTVSLLKYVDNPRDLRKVAKLSEKFGSNTKGVLKVLGKAALKGSVRVLNITTKLVAQMVMFLFSLLVFILTLCVKLLVWKSTRRVVTAI